PGAQAVAVDDHLAAADAVVAVTAPAVVAVAVPPVPRRPLRPPPRPARLRSRVLKGADHADPAQGQAP
ncbi:hypothetical protein ACWEPC_15370, partial [Nonomuraea sp. NPDC004297]